MGKYSIQFKLSAVRAYLERTLGLRCIAEQFQIDPTLLRRWVAGFQLHGEASLQRSRRYWSADFKRSVIHHMWRNQLSFRQAAAVFNLGNSTQIGIWEKQYYSGGFQGLVSGSKRVKKPMPKLPATTSQSSPTNDEDLSHAELLAKLRKLQVENAVLKKLKELREEKKRQAQVARKKPK